MPSRSSAALDARHRALPAHLLGVLTRHRVLPAWPRPCLLSALPSPHVTARCRILDCTPDRSAASLQPWPRLLGVLHPLHVVTLCRIPDCLPARRVGFRFSCRHRRPPEHLVDRRHRCPYPPRRVPLRCETPLVGAIGCSGHPHPTALFAEKGGGSRFDS